MHFMTKTLIAIFLLALAVAAQKLPEPEREFRGVWIATVDNIDFPTKKTLTDREQEAELLKDLDLAVSLNLNAVVFQVRPMCDAIYESKLEPWSEFLTGEMGRGQKFDPLAFLVAEAHKRGILVHAWFNPYRAYHPAAKTVSNDHITKRRPDLVRKYGNYLWLDPSEPDVQKHSLDVVLDVVRRYDIDGVHFDDYFYPYPITENGARVEFPDEENYKKYLATAAKMSTPKLRRIPLKRDDWRRSNVNQFIEKVGVEIKKIKPTVLYGISPFGVAEENYKNLYADAEKWLRDGTIDYFVPQLYWKIDRANREFPKLLKSWEKANVKKRHVWAGIGTYKLYEPKENYSAAEILAQLALTREIQETAGSVQFSFKSLRNDSYAIQAALRDGPYKRAALVPPTPWIKTPKLASPRVSVYENGRYYSIAWPRVKNAFWYVVYAKDKNGWSYSVVPARDTSMALSSDREIEEVKVIAVDRLGNSSVF